MAHPFERYASVASEDVAVGGMLDNACLFVVVAFDAGSFGSAGGFS